MKKIILASILITVCGVYSYAQTNRNPKVRWYLSPSFSTLLQQDHVGIAPGIELGVKILNQRLQVGIIAYNRSGPINPHTETLVLDEGQPYKGKSELQLRADHGAFGIVVAPQFRVGRVILDIPVVFGQIGAGFFLEGDDRITPDGRRTSEWEDDLMGDADAGTGFFLEGGIRAKLPLNSSETIMGGIGVHYTQTLGYETFVGGTDYYNAPRVAVFLQFGN